MPNDLHSSADPGEDEDYDKFDWGTSGACAMRVATRVRPLSGSEKERKERNAWKIEDEAADAKTGRKASQSSVLKASSALEKALQTANVGKASKRTPGRTPGRKGKAGKGKSGGSRRTTYKFQPSSCHDGSCTNSDLYSNVCKPIVQGVMDGINGTIFAYGQTSSGKTHTMMGGKGDPGIIALSTCEMFKAISENPGREYLLRISMCEIYNEVVRDLIDPTKTNLDVRAHRTRGVVISGVTEEIVTSVEQVLDIIEMGTNNRTVGATKMNEGSSRSHTIFRMIVESRDLSTGKSRG